MMKLNVMGCDKRNAEPGYYEEGEFGIRIESDLIVKKSDVSERFFAFENITMVPIQLSLVEDSLLSPSEKKWLLDYNSRCLQVLEPLLSPEELDFLRSHVLP